MDKRENIERHLEESKAERKRGKVDRTRATCERIWNSRTGNNTDVIKGNIMETNTIGKDSGC